MNNTLKQNFTKVGALYKGIRIIELLAESKGPLRISEISKALGFHAGTVYNIVYSLVDLDILIKDESKRFSIGKRLFDLGGLAGSQQELIDRIHPYLEEINKITKFATFMSIRSGSNSAIILDKIESTHNLVISQNIGRRVPLLGAAAGKAILSQLPDSEIDDILSQHKLVKYTPKSCVNKKKYKEQILKTRKDGVTISDEEVTEGIVAVAAPVSLKRLREPISIWIIGLKTHFERKGIPFYKRALKNISAKIQNELI